jgi:hypothetical protein
MVDETDVRAAVWWGGVWGSGRGGEGQALKTVVNGAFSILTLFAVEIFPTTHRHLPASIHPQRTLLAIVEGEGEFLWCWRRTVACLALHLTMASLALP